MCRKLVVTNKLGLGTRELGWEALSLPKGEVHIGSLTPLVEDECMVNLFYIVIGTHKENENIMYDVVSSRFERTSFTAEKLKTLLEMKVVTGGAKLDEESEVVVAPLEKPKTVEKKETTKSQSLQTITENRKQ